MCASIGVRESRINASIESQPRARSLTHQPQMTWEPSITRSCDHPHAGHTCRHEFQTSGPPATFQPHSSHLVLATLFVSQCSMLTEFRLQIDSMTGTRNSSSSSTADPIASLLIVRFPRILHNHPPPSTHQPLAGSSSTDPVAIKTRPRLPSPPLQSLISPFSLHLPPSSSIIPLAQLRSSPVASAALSRPLHPPFHRQLQVRSLAR